MAKRGRGANMVKMIMIMLLFTFALRSKTGHCMTISYSEEENRTYMYYKVLNGIGKNMCINDCRAEGRCWSIGYDIRKFTCYFMDNRLQPDKSFLNQSNEDMTFVHLETQDKLCGGVCSFYEVCVNGSSMEDSFCHDRGIYIGSAADISFSRELGTLYNDQSFRSLYGWVPWTLDDQQYIQFNFSSEKQIKGITTKGYFFGWYYVTSFKVLVLNALESEWEVLTYVNGTEVIFKGNTDGDTSVTHTFSDVHTKSVRVNPITWKGDIFLRVDLLDCDFDHATNGTIVSCQGTCVPVGCMVR